MVKALLLGAMTLAFSPQSFGTKQSFTISPYVFKVTCDEGSGSAFLVEGGRLVSVNHVTRMSNCQIDGKPISVDYVDEVGDLTILSVPGSYRGGFKIDCSGFHDGQWVYGIGHARGAAWHTIVTVLPMSSLKQAGENRGWDVLAYDRFIPGMSGGVVLSQRGEAVGAINAYGIFVPISFSKALKDTPLCQG